MTDVQDMENVICIRFDGACFVTILFATTYEVQLEKL